MNDQKAVQAAKPSKWKKYIFIALGLIMAGALLMWVDMGLFFKVVSLLGIALTVGSIFVMLLTYKKSREIKPGAMAVSVAMSAACLLVYSLFLKSGLGVLVWLLGLAVGAGAGVGWSLVTPLFREGAAVKRAGNIWYLAVWGAIFVLNQSLILAMGRSPAISMMLLIFGTGLVIGNSGAYIAGYYKLKGLNPKECDR
ncbi:MAG: hypothetical protein HY911_14690 [Desulfobacterales bacterium]|nr:hypothetical protein [Desulfobacterales bacterium]